MIYEKPKAKEDLKSILLANEEIGEAFPIYTTFANGPNLIMKVDLYNP